MGKWWRISKIQNHGGSFRPNVGKGWKTTLIFDCFLCFENLASYLLSMNWNFLLLAGKCRVVRFQPIFLVTPSMGSTLHQIIPPPSSLTHNPVYWTSCDLWLISVFLCTLIFEEWTVASKSFWCRQNARLSKEKLHVPKAGKTWQKICSTLKKIHVAAKNISVFKRTIFLPLYSIPLKNFFFTLHSSRYHIYPYFTNFPQNLPYMLKCGILCILSTSKIQTNA